MTMDARLKHGASAAAGLCLADEFAFFLPQLEFSQEAKWQIQACNVR
jgi:hypothetical protein